MQADTRQDLILAQANTSPYFAQYSMQRGWLGVKEYLDRRAEGLTPLFVDSTAPAGTFGFSPYFLNVLGAFVDPLEPMSETAKRVSDWDVVGELIEGDRISRPYVRTPANVTMGISTHRVMATWEDLEVLSERQRLGFLVLLAAASEITGSRPATRAWQRTMMESSAGRNDVAYHLMTLDRGPSAVMSGFERLPDLMQRWVLGQVDFTDGRRARGAE